MLWHFLLIWALLPPTLKCRSLESWNLFFWTEPNGLRRTQTIAETREGWFLNAGVTCFQWDVAWNCFELIGSIQYDEFQAEPLMLALQGQLCIMLWLETNHQAERWGLVQITKGWGSEGANFPKQTGPKAFPATPFQVNIPSFLKLCFSFMCILLHVEEQYGSRKKGFGPNNAVWLEMLPLYRFGIKINFSGRGLLVLVVH